MIKEVIQRQLNLIESRLNSKSITSMSRLRSLKKTLSEILEEIDELERSKIEEESRVSQEDDQQILSSRYSGKRKRKFSDLEELNEVDSLHSEDDEELVSLHSKRKRKFSDFEEDEELMTEDDTESLRTQVVNSLFGKNNSHDLRYQVLRSLNFSSNEEVLTDDIESEESEESDEELLEKLNSFKSRYFSLDTELTESQLNMTVGELIKKLEDYISQLDETSQEARTAKMQLGGLKGMIAARGFSNEFEESNRLRKYISSDGNLRIANNHNGKLFSKKSLTESNDKYTRLIKKFLK
jgi:hypothetical protein